MIRNMSPAELLRRGRPGHARANAPSVLRSIITSVLVTVVTNARSSCVRSEKFSKRPLFGPGRAYQEEEDNHCGHGEQGNDAAREGGLRQVPGRWERVLVRALGQERAAGVGAACETGVGPLLGKLGKLRARPARGRWRTRQPLAPRPIAYKVSRTAALYGTNPGCAACWRSLWERSWRTQHHHTACVVAYSNGVRGQKQAARAGGA